MRERPKQDLMYRIEQIGKVEKLDDEHLKIIIKDKIVLLTKIKCDGLVKFRYIIDDNGKISEYTKIESVIQALRPVKKTWGKYVFEKLDFVLSR